MNDGRAIGFGDSAVHWEIGRMLLEFSIDPIVRPWCRATLVWMEAHENHEPAHAAAALRRFPDDPDLLFLARCLHETLASPKIQAARRSVVLPSGYKLIVGAADEELGEAAQLLRRAVKARPDFPEAHLRLGRVLLIIFSDGVDTASWLRSDTVLESAKRSGVVAYAVSVQSALKPELLRDLTSFTGGRLFEVEKTADLESTFRTIVDEFRHRYLVSYTPRGVAKDGWHRLDVRVKRRGAIVKARPGYLAGS